MLVDLIGQTFGLLTVVEKGSKYVSPKGKTAVRWICRCECGGEALVTTTTATTHLITADGLRVVSSNETKVGGNHAN
jgi:hypothetical protein